MLLHLLVFHLLLLPSPASNAGSDVLPGCPNRCGNISVPYPFGTQPGCYKHPGFLITCKTTYNPPRPFITTTKFRVANISLNGTVIIYHSFARSCNSPLDLKPIVINAWTDVSGLPYTFSYTRNRFTSIGCNTVALNYQYNLTDYSSGCVSFCEDPSSVINGSCSGIGCCQTTIPRGLQRIDTVVRSLPTLQNDTSFNPCSYAFLGDQEGFQFDLTSLYSYYKRRRVAVVLDWAVGNVTCEEATGSGDYACGEKSYCINSTNGPGYRCSCNSGYEGNPYLPHGCQDINECENPSTNPCAQICENTPGGYVCSCPRGFYGDGNKAGSGCIKGSNRFPLVQVAIGNGVGFSLLLVCGSWLYWGLKKRRLIKLKEKYFRQNGGLLLQQQIASSSHQGVTETKAKVFTAEELQRATDNYSESRILGRGGYGTVYKGILPDNRVVAIKKSRLVDETQIEQFVNEVVILSQVVHKNVVKILGCCMETPVPLLVYEYIPNGTLYHHIHNEGNANTLSLETRLRIAVETAGALAYLHSDTATPICHRDVKSANILLDDKYMAKVSDFGASRLIPLDQTQINTLVEGTLGYLDPEYFQTGQLTEKSDVYSFGVVLAELLTGEEPLSQEQQSLAFYFLRCVRENRLFEILEPRVRNEGNREQLQAVADVARRCLELRGEERPAMNEVAAELERWRRRGNHPLVEEEDGENEMSLPNGSATVYYTSQMTERELENS